MEGFLLAMAILSLIIGFIALIIYLIMKKDIDKMEEILYGTKPVKRKIKYIPQEPENN